MAAMDAMAVLMTMDGNNVINIQRLISSFTASVSTAELIVHVAVDKELLSLSRTLISQVDQGQKTKLTEDVRQVCTKEGILIAAFYAEIRKVLQALHLQENPHRDEYELLGLTPGATWEEVKKAYRELSIKYHPDRVGQGSEKKFIQISEAYHALEKESKTNHVHPVNPWRKELRRRDRSKQKCFIATVMVVVLGLVLLSIFYTWRYRQKVYIQQVQEFGRAFDSQGGTLSE